MANSFDSLAKGLQEIISDRDAKKPAPYDTVGTVTRVEGNVAWVKYSGSEISETPVERTIDAKAGDSVTVRNADGRAWLTGNSTAPPTDDTLAQQADTKAIIAYVAAGIAQESALSALDSANRAQISADDAARAANNAWGYAENANTAAIAANNYAGDAYTQAGLARQEAARAQSKADEASGSAFNAATMATAAQFSLSEVQNVMDTLNWMQTHGYYRYCASEQEPIPGKVYYILDGTIIATPSGSPEAQAFYEQSSVGGKTIFIKSTDTVVDSSKTYYTVSPLMVQVPESPSENLYYELIMSETMTQYVCSHLALDSRGLWLLPQPNSVPDIRSSKILISSTPGYEGITIYDENNVPVAHYGADTIIGDPSGYNIKITTGEGARLAFCRGETEVAYINETQLYITKTVVLDEMQLNTKWKWKYDPNDESIYLKWIGGDV